MEEKNVSQDVGLHFDVEWLCLFSSAPTQPAGLCPGHVRGHCTDWIPEANVSSEQLGVFLV